MAQARGAKVVAVTSGSKAETLRRLGAMKTLDRGADLVAELGSNSIDVVGDLVAGPKWLSLLDVLRTGGRAVVAARP